MNFRPQCQKFYKHPGHTHKVKTPHSNYFCCQEKNLVSKLTANGILKTKLI